MDATITNLTAAPLFIPGPNVELPASGTVQWLDTTIETLEESAFVTDAILAGTISVSVSSDARDAAAAPWRALLVSGLPVYAHASLPAGFEGQVVFVSNGRKSGELSGAGTGVPAYFSNAAWRTYQADAAVTI